MLVLLQRTIKSFYDEWGNILVLLLRKIFFLHEVELNPRLQLLMKLNIFQKELDFILSYHSVQKVLPKVVK